MCLPLIPGELTDYVVRILLTLLCFDMLLDNEFDPISLHTGPDVVYRKQDARYYT